jgi:hypothetical protein
VSNRNLRREREWDMIARKLLFKVGAHDGPKRGSESGRKEVG